MIFNKSVFKKFLKEAYKGYGLLVGNNDGEIILAGSWWIMTMDKDVFNKDGRAALVQLTGVLPEQGEYWRSTSAGNQIEMPPDYININVEQYDLTEPLKKTALILEIPTPVRVYQKKDKIVCVNEMVEMLLDPYAVNEGENDTIAGPYDRGLKNLNNLYWTNGPCQFVASTVILEKEDYTKFIVDIGQLDIPVAR